MQQMNRGGVMDSKAIWLFGMVLLATPAGCGGGGGGSSDAGRTEQDGGAHGDVDSDADSDTDVDADSDTDVDAGDDDDGGTDGGSHAPEPAAPCAPDKDADIHPDSDVSQVTGAVVPDLGDVAAGGAFQGNPFLARSVDLSMRRR